MTSRHHSPLKKGRATQDSTVYEGHIRFSLQMLPPTHLFIFQCLPSHLYLFTKYTLNTYYVPALREVLKM